MINNSRQNVYIFLLLVFSALPFLFYIDKVVLDTSTALSINLSSLNPDDITWSRQNGGGLGSFNLSLLPYFLYFSFFELLNVPLGTARILFSIVSFSLCSVGMFYLAKLFFYTKDALRYAFIVGLAAIFNLYVIGMLDGSLYFLLPYLFLPLQAYFYLKGLLDKRYSYILITSLLFLFTFNVNYIFDIVAFIVLLTFGVYFFLQKRVKFAEIAISLSVLGVLLLLENLYVLIPLIKTALENREGVISALTSEGFYNFETNPLNVLRTLGDWGFFSGFGEERYHSFSPLYLNNPLFVISTFLAPFVFLLTFIISQKRTEVIWLLLVVVAIISFILGGNTYSPFAQLYFLATEKIPFFVAFKNTYKFTVITLVIFNLFYGFFLERIKEFRFTVFFRSFITGTILFFIFIQGFPLITGTVYEKARYFSSLPQYWTSMGEYINDETKVGDSVFITPIQYTNVFSWDRKRVGLPNALGPTIIERQVFQPTYDMYSSNAIANSIFKDVSKNLDKEKNLGALMGYFGIGYILQMNDADWEYYESASPSAMKSVLEASKGVKKVKTIDKLDLYKINSHLVNPFFYSSSKLYFLKDLSVDNNIATISALVDNGSLEDASLYIYKGELVEKDFKDHCPLVVKEISECRVEKAEIVTWHKYNETKYDITLKVPRSSFLLIMGTTYDPNWELYKDGQRINAPHFPVDIYKNGWFIKGEDKSMVKLEIIFKTQSYFKQGAYLSLLVVGLQIIVLLYILRRERQRT